MLLILISLPSTQTSLSWAQTRIQLPAEHLLTLLDEKAQGVTGELATSSSPSRTQMRCPFLQKPSRQSVLRDAPSCDPHSPIQSPSEALAYSAVIPYLCPSPRRTAGFLGAELYLCAIHGWISCSRVWARGLGSALSMSVERLQELPCHPSPHAHG